MRVTATEPESPSAARRALMVSCMWVKKLPASASVVGWFTVTTTGRWPSTLTVKAPVALTKRGWKKLSSAALLPDGGMSPAMEKLSASTSALL
jgi:hypothetical protein